MSDSRANGLQFDNSFWRFSLIIYGHGEVAKECLALQDELGIDVNLLLFCAWLGTQAIALSRENIEAASRTVVDWYENVVRPLRAVRRQARTFVHCEFDRFIASVNDAEIKAEQVEQAILFAYSAQIQGVHAKEDTVAQNVKEYIEMMAEANTRCSVQSAPRLIETARRLKP
jgi:uncharacterized protein (TIGR02444 family)